MVTTVSALALMSAAFYCIATFAMKSWAEVPSLGLALIIGATLIVAGTFEVFALRHERLGLIYFGILGAEVFIIGAVSLLLFNESYTTREMLGIGLVLVGTALVWT